MVLKILCMILCIEFCFARVLPPNLNSAVSSLFGLNEKQLKNNAMHDGSSNIGLAKGAIPLKKSFVKYVEAEQEGDNKRAAVFRGETLHASKVEYVGKSKKVRRSIPEAELNINESSVIYIDETTVNDTADVTTKYDLEEHNSSIAVSKFDQVNGTSNGSQGILKETDIPSSANIATYNHSTDYPEGLLDDNGTYISELLNNSLERDTLNDTTYLGNGDDMNDASDPNATSTKWMNQELPVLIPEETEETNTSNKSNLTALDLKANETPKVTSSSLNVIPDLDTVKQDKPVNISSQAESYNKTKITKESAKVTANSTDEVSAAVIEKVTSQSNLPSQNSVTNETNETSNQTSQGLLDYLMNSELAKNAANAINALNPSDSSITDHLVDDSNDIHDLLDANHQEKSSETPRKTDDNPEIGNNTSSDTNLNTLVSGNSSASNVTEEADPRCPPPGLCILWFMSQDTCEKNIHCLGTRICCKIRCSKTCIELE